MLRLSLKSLVQVCSCKNDAYCEPEDGTCVCSPGWLGELCDQQCETGKYGKNCQYECRCKNGASCDPESGQCKCVPGWQGIFCDKVCPEGKYGADCSKTCDCKNGASCHHITGGGQAILFCEPITMSILLRDLHLCIWLCWVDL